MRGILKYIRPGLFSVVLLVVSCILPVGNSYSADENNENDIKALFILNFIKYVNWPPELEKVQVSIGVAGDSEIYNSLIKVILKRSENKNIVVDRITAETVKEYKVVFISKEETRNMSKWINKYSGKGVLLISEGCNKNFGAAINLINVNNSIRFEINNTGAQVCGVKISSRLMDLASTVKP